MKSIKIMGQTAYCDDNGYWFRIGTHKKAKPVEFDYTPKSELVKLPNLTEAKEYTPVLYETVKEGTGYPRKIVLQPAYVKRVMTMAAAKKYTLELRQEKDYALAPVFVYAISSKGEKLLGGILPMNV